MSFSDIKLGILEALKNLPTILSDWQIVWPNAGFDEATAQVERFAVVSVMNGRTAQADMGSPGNARTRTPGIVQIALHVPVGEGEGSINAKADEIVPLVKQRTSDGVVFRSPSVQTRGRVNGGAHWRVDVVAPFYADTID